MTANRHRRHDRPVANPVDGRHGRGDHGAGRGRAVAHRSPSPSRPRRCSTRSRSPPAPPDCGSANLCSGADRHRVGDRPRAPRGAPLAGRQIRFDVVYGPYRDPVDQSGDAAGADAHGRHRHQRGCPGRPPGRRQRADAAGADPRHRPHHRPARSSATSPSSTAPSTASAHDRAGDGDDHELLQGRVQQRVPASTTSSTAAIRPTACPRRSRRASTCSDSTVNDERRPLQAITNGTCVEPADVHDRRRGRQADDRAAREPPRHRGPAGTADAGSRPRRSRPTTSPSTGCTGIEGVPVRRHRRHADLRHQHQHAGAHWSSRSSRVDARAAPSRSAASAASARRRSSSSTRAGRRRPASAIINCN